MSTSKGPLKDARGVDIQAGDVCLYGFGVGRSVAMAEGVVIPADNVRQVGMGIEDWKPSVTRTGRVRIRVVRRSYGGGEKPVVDIAPDRLVVLKKVDGPFQPGTPEPCFALPRSPLPTQDEENYTKVVSNIERHQARVDQLRAGAELHNHEAEVGGHYPDYEYDYSMDRRRYWIGVLDKWCAEERAQLQEICARLGRDMPV